LRSEHPTTRLTLEATQPLGKAEPWALRVFCCPCKCFWFASCGHLHPPDEACLFAVWPRCSGRTACGRHVHGTVPQSTCAGSGLTPSIRAAACHGQWVQQASVHEQTGRGGAGAPLRMPAARRARACRAAAHSSAHLAGRRA